MIDLSQVQSAASNDISGPPFWTVKPDGSKLCRILLTYSNINLFQSCKWKYRARQFWQLRPVGKKATLMIGGGFHDAIEYYYNKVPDCSLNDDALIETMSFIDQSIGLLEDGKDALVKAMVKAFIRWSHAKSKYRMVAQEQEFVVRMEDAPDFEHDGIEYQFWLSGKVDAFMNFHDGSFWLGEWKTCTSFQDFQNKIKIDNQPWQYMLLYYLTHGKFPDGTVYRLAKKSAIRIKKSETVDEFRERYIQTYEEEWESHIAEEVVPFDPYRLDEHIDLLNQSALDIRHAVVNETWSRNRGSCFDYNSACPYMSLCGARDKSSFDVIAGQGFEYHRANEELAVSE